MAANTVATQTVDWTQNEDAEAPGDKVLYSKGAFVPAPNKGKPPQALATIQTEFRIARIRCTEQDIIDAMDQVGGFGAELQDKSKYPAQSYIWLKNGVAKYPGKSDVIWKDEASHVTLVRASPRGDLKSTCELVEGDSQGCHLTLRGIVNSSGKHAHLPVSSTDLAKHWLIVGKTQPKDSTDNTKYKTFWSQVKNEFMEVESKGKDKDYIKSAEGQALSDSLDKFIVEFEKETLNLLLEYVKLLGVLEQKGKKVATVVGKDVNYVKRGANHSIVDKLLDPSPKTWDAWDESAPAVPCCEQHFPGSGAPDNQQINIGKK